MRPFTALVVRHSERVGLQRIVAFVSAKARSFAERKATIVDPKSKLCRSIGCVTIRKFHPHWPFTRASQMVLPRPNKRQHGRQAGSLRLRARQHGHDSRRAAGAGSDFHRRDEHKKTSRRQLVEMCYIFKSIATGSVDDVMDDEVF